MSTPNFSSNKLSYVLSWFNLPRDSNISFLKGDLVCSLCGVHCRINPLPELSGSHEEQMLLLLGGYQDVVLVLSLFLCAVLECGDSVAVLLVGKPLSCQKEFDSKQTNQVPQFSRGWVCNSVLQLQPGCLQLLPYDSLFKYGSLYQPMINYLYQIHLAFS